jgi:hypothetical protein
LKRGVRLYVIQAREADSAVVFRRGPSKRVMLIGWNTSDDTLVDGQWLKGRIYERRCDLSPNGDLLLYFAASYRKPYFSWSAVSRPPFLTALAMWPKGDGWGGGGLFETSRRILLNHRDKEMDLADGFKVPKRFEVRPFGVYAGWGEDNPVWFERLEREGWIRSSEGASKWNAPDAEVWIQFDPAPSWDKQHPRWAGRYVLRMSLLGVKEKNGPWYLIDHTVIDKVGNPVLPLGKTDWADWAHSGDLLFAKGGKLWRLRMSVDEPPSIDQAALVADLSDRVFEARKAPPEALCWPALSSRARASSAPAGSRRPSRKG